MRYADDKHFPIVSLWNLVVALATKVSIDFHEKRMPSIPHKRHVTDEKWLRSGCRLWRYNCSKVLTDDGRRTDHYPISSPGAFVPGEIKKGLSGICPLAIYNAPSEDSERTIRKPTQWAHNFKITSYQRRCDVITSHRRWYDIILMLCACWVGWSESLWAHMSEGTFSDAAACMLRRNIFATHAPYFTAWLHF